MAQLDGIDKQAMDRLGALVAGAVSSRSGDSVPLRVETAHDPRRHGAKVVAIGGAEDTAVLLSLLATFAKAQS